MAGVKAEVLDYEADEEHILRRIGGALVVQWGALPAEFRDLLLEQAVFMHDRDQTVQLKEQIEMFIRKHTNA